MPPLAFAALQKHFPDAREVKWEQSYGWYRANFRRAHTQQAALFSDYGNLEESAVAVLLQALPSPVRHALATYYPGMTVRASVKMVNATTGALTYEAKMLENGEACTVLFDADGREVRNRPKK